MSKFRETIKKELTEWCEVFGDTMTEYGLPLIVALGLTVGAGIYYSRSSRDYEDDTRKYAYELKQKEPSLTDDQIREKRFEKYGGIR